jgi:hypothetical protein
LGNARVAELIAGVLSGAALGGEGEDVKVISQRVGVATGAGAKTAV